MARIGHYDVGDTWTPQATFTVGGTPTDPTNITVKTLNAAGTVTTIGPVSGATGGSGIVRVSAGVFKTDVALTAAGYWKAQFIGTGTAAATEVHEAIVDPSEFDANAGLSTRALVGLAETKDWLQQQNIDTSSDLELVRVINDISDRFHREAQREFKPLATNPATRTFEIEELGSSWPWYVDGEYMGEVGSSARTLKIGDLAAVPTAVQILDSDWTTVLETVTVATEVTALPQVREPWEPITALLFNATVTPLSVGYRVSVTGTWGFPAVPGNVRQAVLDGVAAVMDRNVEHYSTDLASAGGTDTQNVIMVGGGSQRLLSLPPAAQAVAWDYRNVSLG